MPSQRETNTMAEGLQRVLSEITKMKVMPDSDMEFLMQLETAIIGYLRAPEPEPAPAAPAMGSPLDGAMSQVMGGAPMMGAPGMSPGMPNPDEMRRMLTQ